jgi:thioredoxin 1
MLEINESAFEKEVMQSDQIVLVDFFAPWCGPCRMLTPALESIENKNTGLKVVKNKIDEKPNISGQYNVSSIPAMVFVKNGKLETTLVGLQPENKIQAVIDSIASV